MNEFSTDAGKRQFSGAASLAALGLHLQHVDLFAPVRRLVKIGQKTVKHSPSDKLYDAWIAILAGAHGLVEINTRLRSDPALQAAFGRLACAEQSVVQETFDACTADNVSQLQQALDAIYRQHSQGYRHDYAQAWQIVDADLTGMPCGPKAAWRPKATSPSSAIAVAASWAACRPPAIRRWSSINCIPARPTCAPPCQN